MLWNLKLQEIYNRPTIVFQQQKKEYHVHPDAKKIASRFLKLHGALWAIRQKSVSSRRFYTG